jgi:hypothetical protein
MAWVKLSGVRSCTGRTSKPRVMLYPQIIRFNTVLYAALGNPEFVNLLFDAERQLLGIGKSAASDRDAIPVHEVPKGGYRIAGASMFRSLGLSVTAPFPRLAEDCGEGVWGISVAELCEGHAP